MSIKYSLNDVLLEAGVLDYRQIETDKTWSASADHIRIMKKIYKKEKNDRYGALIKALYGVAAAAALFIIIISVKPLREGASSFLNGIFREEPVETVTSDITSVSDGTETENAVSGTEKEETGEPRPKTDMEAIAEMIDDIIDNGYTADKWDELKSYDEKAYLYCVDMYFNNKCDQNHRAVYSIFCIELAAPEIRENMPEFAGRNEKLLSFTSDALQKKAYYAYHNELQRFREAVEPMMTSQFRKSDTYKNMYYTDLMFDLIDYSYYRAGSPDTQPKDYNARNKFAAENVAYLNVHGIQACNEMFARSVCYYEGETEELLELYKTGDEKTKASVSVMLALGIQHWDSEDATQAPRMTLSDFFGEEGCAYLMSVNEQELKTVNENTDLRKYADWLDNFIVYLKEASSNHPEDTVKEDREVCYTILQYLGFDNYYVCGEYESKVEAVLSEFIELYDGVTGGTVYVDRRDEYFSNQPGADDPLPDALIQRIRVFVSGYDPETVDDGYPPYDFTYSTLKGDIRTADGLRDKFNELLDDAELAGYLSGYENESFLIVDGLVYMICAPREGGYRIRAYLQPGSVKVTDEGDGYTVVTADIRWSKDRSETHTFYTKNGSDEIKIKNGGSFFDTYIDSL